MAIDDFKTVNWTAGQEVRAQDLSDSQKFLSAMLSDQIMAKLTAGDIESSQPHDPGAIADGGGQTGVCHALTVAGGQPRRGSANNKIKITAGTVFVRTSGGETGNDRTFLPWTFDGTDELTIANGHATQFRWDLIQLKLELANTDPQSRVFANPTVAASLDLETVSAGFTVVVASTIPGSDSNSIRVRAQPWIGPGVQITEVGRDVTIAYVSGVSTVQNVVDAITADATLIVVVDYSAVSTVLADPGHTFIYNSLVGGLDTVILSNTLNMKHRVQATLNVKQGATFTTPGTYPGTPDSGFVAVGAVLVPPAWAAAKAPSYWMEEQFASVQLLPILHDLRLPMNVREYTVEACDMFRDSSWWINDGRWGDVSEQVKSNTGSVVDDSAILVARCPVTVGRLVGITVVAGGGSSGGTATTGGAGAVVGTATFGGAIVAPFFNPGGLVDLAGSDISSLWAATEATPKHKHADQELIGKNQFNVGFSSVFSGTIGFPMWCNGGRVCVDDVEPVHYKFRFLNGGGGVAIDANPHAHGLCVVFLPSVDARVQSVTFYVAEGL